MLLLQKSFTTAAYWQRTHGTAAPRGCEAGRGGTESRRTDERWDILAELLPRQGTLSWPARAAPAASFSLLHSPHHTTLFCLTLLTPSTFIYCSKFLQVKFEAIHYIKFRNVLRSKYVRVRAILKIQNVVQDGTLKMQRICPVSGFSWEKSVYWATWRV